MSIELVPLCTGELELRDPLVVSGAPAGDRMIFEVASARFEGDRFSASLKGVAAADWAILGPGAIVTLDVKLTLETDDGALLFAQYGGRSDVASFPEPSPVYVTPRFETGDERYAWLNRIQAVGKGLLDGKTLTYEWYELR